LPHYSIFKGDMLVLYDRNCNILVPNKLVDLSRKTYFCL